MHSQHRVKLYAQRMAPLGKVRAPVYSAQSMHRAKIMTHYEIQHPLGFHTIYKLGNEPINRAIVALIIKKLGAFMSKICAFAKN